jgi:transposase
MFLKPQVFMQSKFHELTDSQWEIIEKLLEDNRPLKHELRVIVNSILWITRTGAQWRNLESKYPPWQSVYYYFRKWSKNGLWKDLLQSLVKAERIRQQRSESPSLVAVDSQSVKISCLIDQETVGIDGGKKVNGRKRHIAVDSLGLPLAVHVSPADVHDSEGGMDLLQQLEDWEENIELILADNAYGGEFKKMAEAAYGYKVDTSQRPPSQKGFVPQKGRWQVERTFAWLNFFRRLSRDFEKTTCSAEAFIRIAFINIILNRSEPI